MYSRSYIPLIIGVFLVSQLNTGLCQELGHFTNETEIDFEESGIYAELIPTNNAAATTISKTTGPATTADVAANEKEAESKTSEPIREVEVARVVGEGQPEEEVEVTTTPKATTASTTTATKFAEISATDLEENSPPYITFPVSPSRVIIKQGTSKVFQCTAVSNVAPQYTWLLNGIPFDDSKPYVKAFSNGTLIFLDYSSRDDGLYRCTAKNANGKAMSVQVPIVAEVVPAAEAPAVTRKIKVLRYSRASLACGEVPMTIPEFLKKWYTSKSNEVRTDGRIGIDSEGTLHFAFTDMEDSSSEEYVCGLAPPSVSTSPTIALYNPVSLEVQDSVDPGDAGPEEVFYTKDAKAVIGAEFIFECFFAARPVVSIAWKNSSNHNVEAGDSRYEVFDQGRKLRVKSVRQEDEGSFRCTASNDVASREIVMPLNVTTPPLRTDGGSLTTHTSPDQRDFTLMCRGKAADGEHMEAPVWYRNAEALREENFPDPARYTFNNDRTTLTITELDKEVDTASFQCEVINSEGSLFMNGYLRVIHSIEITKRPAEVIKVASNDTDGSDLTVIARGDSCCEINRLYYFNNTLLSEDRLRQAPFRRDESGVYLTFVPSLLSPDKLADWMGDYKCRVSNAHQDLEVAFTITMEDEPTPVIATSSSSSLWWVGVLCGVLAIAIVIIIVIVIYKSNYPGDTYMLDKTERKHNLNPQEDLMNQSFQEI